MQQAVILDLPAPFCSIASFGLLVTAFATPGLALDSATESNRKFDCVCIKGQN